MKIFEYILIFSPLILFSLLAIFQILNIIRLKDAANAAKIGQETFGENVDEIRAEIKYLIEKIDYLQKTLDAKKDTQKDKWRDKRDPVTGRLRA